MCIMWYWIQVQQEWDFLIDNMTKNWLILYVHQCTGLICLKFTYTVTNAAILLICYFQKHYYDISVISSHILMIVF